MSDLKFTQYHIYTEILNDVGIPNKRIIFSTRTATSILIDEEKYQLALSNKFSKIDDSLFTVLKEKGFLVPFEENEYFQIISKNNEKKNESEYLSMTIQPTANCQLGCHYCGQIHTKDYADDKVIDKYYERIDYLLNQNSNYKGVSITWYGGEPLTGLSSVMKTSKRLIQLCKDRKFDYLSDIITNGLSLKPKIFETLVKDCRITDYQITIDGVAESHDKRRMTKSGKPTFNIIMQNIIDVTNTETYSKYNCKITIRINIDKTNYQFIEPLIHFIKEKGLQRKVSVYFATIVDFGSNNAGEVSLEKDFFAKKEIEWLHLCYENGIDVNILPERVYSVCMVENKDSEVYDAFGNIYACWEFPYDKEYSKGNSLIGNLFNPKETYNENATLRDWTEVVDSGKTWCKTCFHLPVCGGGCPKSWHEDKPACPTFKFNYKDKLLLDYYVRKTKKKENIQV